MNLSQASFAAAGEFLGLKEWPGAKHNPEIVKMFADTGNDWINDDETPWCAAFVGSVLASIGVHGTGKLNARSYEKWGHGVTWEDVIPGDLCVFWRGKRDGWQGHVAFFHSYKDGKLKVRGGNQGDAVSDKVYNKARLLAVRRATAPKSAKEPAQPIAPPTSGLSAIIKQVLAALMAMFGGKK